MLSLVACSALLLFAADPPSDVNEAYAEARAKATRSPDDQIRLALWCERNGLLTQKLNHLTLAILADPGNITARGLMGLVAREGRWLRPEAIAENARINPVFAEYETKRLATPYTADAQWTLGVWAEDHGLKEQAKAHFTAVTRIDPSREHAWKRLGFKKHDGRWTTEAHLAADRAEVEAQKAADKAWRPKVDHLKAMLDRPANRDEAEAALAEITDPRAVPSIVAAFAKGRDSDQIRAVQLLGQIDAPRASRTLAGLAIFAKSAEVRRVAIETLKARDPRDFVGLWIGLIHSPVKFQVKPVGGPGSPGTIEIEGETVKHQRKYSPPGMPDVPVPAGTKLTYDASGLPVLTEALGTTSTNARIVWLPYYSYNSSEFVGAVKQAAHGANLQQVIQSAAGSGRPVQQIAGYLPYVLMNGELTPINGNLGWLAGGGRLEQQQNLQIPIGQMAVEYAKSAQTAQEQLKGDAASLETLNAAIRRSNELTLHALGSITGQKFGDDPIAWNQWWTDQEGMVLAMTQMTDKATIIEEVPLGYTPQAVPQVVGGAITVVRHHSCFAAGTTVRTINGDRPIETIQRGDLVLVQDTKTGSLGYQSVLAAYHNPPNATLKISLAGSDTVVATGIHRFWKAGQGWTMARDLKPGDQVRTLGGIAVVESVSDDRVQPVFNLEVGEGHSFLVGKLGTLVHDNSLVEPVANPFDAAAKPTK